MDVKKIVESYGKKVTIGVLGSHSAEEVGMAAKAAGMEIAVVCQKGRDTLYTKHSKHLFDHVICWINFLTLQKKKRRKNCLS